MLRKRSRLIKIVMPVAILILMAITIFVIADELHTSRLQAYFLTRLGHHLNFHIEPGPSESILYPTTGPYDQRLGYTRLPSFLDRLNEREYSIIEQARQSPKMRDLIKQSLYAPYREKDQSGLTFLDCNNLPIYTGAYPERSYANFAAIPSLLTDSLLYIENRTLLNTDQPRRNPAIEWGRFAHAVWDRAVHLFQTSAESPGGSTLATQIEKYRHSPDGRTGSATEKIRQMFSASVRAYLGGEDTTKVRRELVTHYVNTVPLGARASFGEINGLGDGLWVWYGRDFKQINLLLDDNSQAPLAMRALAYKEVLSLLISQRSPSYFLAHIVELEILTNSYLHLLANAGVITPTLRDAALLLPLSEHKANTQPTKHLLEHKGVNAVRGNLASLLGVQRVYDLETVS